MTIFFNQTLINLRGAPGGSKVVVAQGNSKFRRSFRNHVRITKY